MPIKTAIKMFLVPNVPPKCNIFNILKTHLYFSQDTQREKKLKIWIWINENTSAANCKVEVCWRITVVDKTISGDYYLISNSWPRNVIFVWVHFGHKQWQIMILGHVPQYQGYPLPRIPAFCKYKCHCWF